MSGRNRHGRFPYAPGPDNRNELLLSKLRLDRCNSLVTTNHALQTSGQPRVTFWIKFARLHISCRYRNDEAVAAPRHVCDIAPAGIALSERFSQCRDVDTKADRVGPLVGPDTLKQIALADNRAWLFDQRNEDVHG